MNPFVKQAVFGAILFVAGVSFGWIIGTVKTYQETAGIVAESDFKNAAAGLDEHVAGDEPRLQLREFLARIGGTQAEYGIARRPG